MNTRLFPLIAVLFVAACETEDKSATSTGGVIQVAGDDPEMIAAMQEARDTFGKFWEDVREDSRRPIPVVSAVLVKAYFADDSDPDAGEHLWIDEVSYDGSMISGKVASEPLDLMEPKLGGEVTFPLDRLSDWLIVDSGVAKGGFTIQLLRGRMSEDERVEHDSHYPFSFPAPQ